MVRFRSAVKLGVVVGLIWTTSALAQINQNDGPLVAPIQREPTVGLPEQAPAPVQPAEVPQPAAPARPAEPRPAPAAQAQPAAPQQPTPAASSTSAWQLECLERDAQARICQAILRSLVGEQIAMVLAIAKDPAGDTVRLQMALPLGIDVQRGVTITVDDFNETLKPSRCTAQGCLVEAAASPELLAALRSGNSGGVRVYSTDGQTIDLPMPLQSAASVFLEAGLD